MSNTNQRKMWNTIAHWGGAIAFVSLYIFDTTVVVAMFLLCAAVGLNSGVYTGFLTNHMDLAPNFAGTLMGITNSIATITAIFGPLLVGFIVTDSVRRVIYLKYFCTTCINNFLLQGNKDQWGTVFLLSAGFFFIGNLIYIIFGTAKVQPWNDSSKNNEKEYNEIPEKI